MSVLQVKASDQEAIYVSSIAVVSCPPRQTESWNKHPRVYLKFQTGKTSVRCPYCGQLFIQQ